MELQSSDPVTSILLGLLGVVLGGINIPIGIQCTPITVIGVGSGANCVQQPVCCAGNTFVSAYALFDGRRPAYAADERPFAPLRMA